MSLSFYRPPPVSLFEGGDVPTLLYSDPARGGDGKVRINPEKQRCRWRTIAATVNKGTPFTIPLSGTVTAVAEVNPQGSDQDGHFEAFSINTLLTPAGGGSGGSTGTRVAVRPEVISPTLSRYLSNVPISSALLSGTSQFPGLLPQTIFCQPDTSWRFDIQNLPSSPGSVNASLVLQGRQFSGCSPEYTQQLMRRAQILQWCHPYWIGPKDPADPSLTGPEVSLSLSPLFRPQTILTFQVPSDADFLLVKALDDSSKPGGGALSLYAQISSNFDGRGFADLTGLIAPAGTSPLGLDWTSFVATPSPVVAGFSGGKINAFSLANGVHGWPMLIPRNTQITILFTNKDTGNITLRVALFGYLIYGRQPDNRQTSVDGQANQERVDQGNEFLERMGLTSVFAGGGAA